SQSDPSQHAGKIGKGRCVWTGRSAGGSTASQPALDGAEFGRRRDVRAHAGIYPPADAGAERKRLSPDALDLRADPAETDAARRRGLTSPASGRPRTANPA